MQPPSWLKKIQLFFETFPSKYTQNRCFILLFLFLLAVLLISFIYPVLNFGRFFGTDDYQHLYHTTEMATTKGMVDFYDRMGTLVSNPASGENEYNYPFGLWLLGATIAKLIGLPPITADFLFVIVFLGILLGSFYIYTSVFLVSKEQKILAILFLLCMPNAALSLLSYRPSIFILPFLFILLYVTFKEPIQWKLLPIAWMLIFIITISHTGSLIFILLFFLLFFVLYCFVWGRFSLSVFLTILSTFAIYIFSIRLFPEIANQYNVKSTLLLTPGNFLAGKFNFTLPLDLGTVFYQNIMVNLEIIYIFILGGFIFAIGKVLIYVHRKIAERFSRDEQMFPVTLPVTKLSHSIIATPLWIGPLHVLFSVIGFFRLESKGKCVLVTTLLITIIPDILSTAQEGQQAGTGALREISYLYIIIPITAALGFLAIVSYLETLQHARKNLILLTVWVLVLSVVIITPVFATNYYLPKISGEDYVIDGMKWLGDSGNVQGKVAGYGYRTVATYTNMTDVSYGLQNGWETRTFLGLIKSIYFTSNERDANDLLSNYGVRYILTSNYLTANFMNTVNNLTIDRNPALNKIYSSKDFAVYEITTSITERPLLNTGTYGNISFHQVGSSIVVDTDVYKVVLNGNYPTIERFGSSTDNYLGDGSFSDSIQISGLRQQATTTSPFSLPNKSDSEDLTIDWFDLTTLPVTPEITDNQITYRTILKDQQYNESEATLLIRYTFFSKSVKREFFITHDWVTSPDSSDMVVLFQTQMFVPLNEFVIKNSEIRKERRIYPAMDNVILRDSFQDLYVHSGDRGIYIKNEPTTAYPSRLAYKGSVNYNMSTLVISQSDYLESGATMHITQFLSLGDEITAERNILSQANIHLLDYPKGITPIILSGYRTTSSGTGMNDTSEQGYQFLRDEGIPYSEIIVPVLTEQTPVVVQNVTSADTIPLVAQTLDIRDITDKNIQIIGSGRAGTRNYNDNFTTQETSISSLIEYMNSKNVWLIGYMPNSLSYNLDTLKIISDKQIPFIISREVYPPSGGEFGLETRDPQMASYHNEGLDVVLFPVSYPISTALSYGIDNTAVDTVFSAWAASINEAAQEDKMTLFIIRSEDIGNPEYTGDIRSLIMYAKDKGLTFTTPDIIADHFKNIQNIRYYGTISGDRAVIDMTNDNDMQINGVTFKIRLPRLNTGNYIVHNGTYVRTRAENDDVIVYASTDISAHASKEIIIESDTSPQIISVNLPIQPVEGPMTISLKDAAGNPLRDADVIIDLKYYHPDLSGEVKIEMTRGVHTIQIICPGYETYNTKVNVKGRYALIQQFFRNITGSVL